jgi:hypothetical protein
MHRMSRAKNEISGVFSIKSYDPELIKEKYSHVAEEEDKVEKGNFFRVVAKKGLEG